MATLSYKCRSCGSEMSVDSSGALVCEYCGSKYNLKDEELKDYRVFRQQMLEYLRRRHDENLSGGSEEENRYSRLWDMAQKETFTASDGEEITLSYLYSSAIRTGAGFPGAGVIRMFITRNNVIYVFNGHDSHLADAAVEMVSKIRYPAADVRGLKECFPVFAGRYELRGGALNKGVMLIYERPANLFPLSMFGAFTPEHAAWIVSRMENICCVLFYSGLTHGGITEDNFFINPFSHHGALIGGWWSAGQSYIGRDNTKDLKDVRKTADHILGIHRNDIPDEFDRFIRSRPEKSAYDDFARWDEVIEKGFGGRRFAGYTGGET